MFSEKYFNYISFYKRKLGTQDFRYTYIYKHICMVTGEKPTDKSPPEKLAYVKLGQFRF